MITSELFGTAPCGTPVHRYTLNGPEICVRIMDYGATVLGIDVPDIPGNVRDVVLGFDKLEDYFDNPACFGATIGPVANRTAGATITIDGTDWHMPANEGVNNLHSDLEHGLHKLAELAHDAKVVTARFASPALGILDVVGAKLAKAVGTKEHLVGGLVGEQHLGPVNIGGTDKG